jgi:hypothetical protein
MQSFIFTIAVVILCKSNHSASLDNEGSGPGKSEDESLHQE